MIWPLNKIFTRNYAVADAWMTQMGQPVYTNWTIQKAVKDGYKINGWVYRSVYLIAKAISQVGWTVVNQDGERQDTHHLSRTFKNPNPYISRQDMMELVSAWLELGGNSYLKKVQAGGKTVELWPVSPDRLAPIPSKRIDEWLKGYALDHKNSVEFTPEEIIHHKFFNPANPLLGIAPLQAAARAVDADNEQQDWNKAAMQNRGVVDGVVTFKQNIKLEKAAAIKEKLNEQMAGPKNARRIQVLGGEAKYARMGLNPAEMDFANSRKFNREEIFIVFGVPPVYAGITDAATLNNYKNSELIFWFQTIIPLLDDLKDTFNRSFHDELGENESINYDLSSIRAIREAMLEWTKTAKELHEMGVPFEQLNKSFEFGFSEFDGWEKSFVKVVGSQAIEGGDKIIDGSADARAAKLTLIERRNYEDEQDKIAQKAEGPVRDIFLSLLGKQREALFKDLTEENLYKVVDGSQADWEAELKKIYVDIGTEFGAGIVIEKREMEKAVADAIEAFLVEESIILTEVSQIAETTVNRCLEQILNGLENGSSINDIQQAIIDTGVLPLPGQKGNEARALMLARTITGSAANIGQMTSASMSGATHKTWRTASHEVRESHQKMNGVTVKIDETFTVGGRTARYPGDNRLPPKEKCNCRCTLTYSIED